MAIFGPTPGFKAILQIITVISIAPYLIDKGEHIELYKIYKNVYIKP